VLYDCIACPFFRSNPVAAAHGCQRNSTHDRPLAVTRSSSCSKNSFKAGTTTKGSICSAYRTTRELFAGLIASAVTPKSVIFGSVIRLAFHDAGKVDMTKPNDKLGPDGCLSNDGSSDGLTEPNCITQLYLEPMYQLVCDRISRADFWILLSKLVLEQAISPPMAVSYEFGRRDNVQCEAGGGRLPSAEGDLSEFRRVFVTQMGLSMADAGKLLPLLLRLVCGISSLTHSCTVTLLGAHSLGHTHIATSTYGFRKANTTDPDLLNAWDNTPAALDNDYYIKLIQLVSV
jgi:hypothetical protein